MFPSHQSASLRKKWLDSVGYLDCGCVSSCRCGGWKISGCVDGCISVDSDVRLSELIEASGVFGFGTVGLLEYYWFGLFGFHVLGISCCIYVRFHGNVISSLMYWLMFGVSWFVGLEVSFVFSMLFMLLPVGLLNGTFC